MRYLLFIIFLAFCSCLGVVDEKVLVPYTKPPFIKEIVGTYEADSFTYQLIKKKKIYEEKKMSLILLEDNTFKGENFPDFLNLLKPDSIKGELFMSQALGKSQK